MIAGREVPVVGRISMDLMTLDVTSLGEHEVDVGTPVELLAGPGGIDRVAEAAGTIGYELLTRLGQRFRRIYLESTGCVRIPQPLVVDGVDADVSLVDLPGAEAAACQRDHQQRLRGESVREATNPDDRNSSHPASSPDWRET
jgi:hypothetical protein